MDKVNRFIFDIAAEYFINTDWHGQKHGRALRAAIGCSQETPADLFYELLYLFDAQSYRRNTKRSLPYRTCCFTQRGIARNVPVRKHYTAGYYDYKGNKNREAGFGINIPPSQATGLTELTIPPSQATGLNDPRRCQEKTTPVR